MEVPEFKPEILQPLTGVPHTPPPLPRQFLCPPHPTLLRFIIFDI